MRTVFMGTPDFALPTLEHLNRISHICLVVTKPDVRKNRGKKLLPSPVKMKAGEMGLDVVEPENIRDDREFIDAVRSCEPDFIVVTAYGKLLTREILQIPKYACVNVHGSLLPKYRGAAPVQRAILEGEKYTGVTIMKMAEGMDTGDMYIKESTEVGDKKCSELWEELSLMGGRLIERALPLIQRGELIAEPQDDKEATYAPFITKEEGRIDFSKTPGYILRQIRGLDMWPGAYCNYGETIMKVWDGQHVEGTTDRDPGTILGLSDQGMDVAAGGGILRICEIQMPGKKPVSVKEYLKGNSIDIEMILR